MAGMQVQRVEPIRAQVARALRSAIGDQRILPGQLLAERELCAMTGASRASVREALRQLESEGLVTSLPGKGTVVSSISAAQANEVYQIRGVLEGLAGRLFTDHACAEQRAALRAALRRFEELNDDPGGLLAASRAFYDILFAGAGNTFALEMSLTLQRRISLLRSTSVRVPGRRRQTLEELRAIVAAVDSGDAEETERRCREHVDRAANAALRYLDQAERAPAEYDPNARLERFAAP